MKTFLLAYARVLTGLAFLTALGFTVFFLVRGPIMAAVALAALAAIFGYFVYRDIRSLVAARKKAG